LTVYRGRFAVNLRYKQDGGDIAFHFNPRLNEGVVVRNSQLGGSWGPEERDQPSFPFAAGQQFTMIILCEPNDFKVSNLRSETSNFFKQFPTDIFNSFYNSAWISMQP